MASRVDFKTRARELRCPLSPSARPRWESYRPPEITPLTRGQVWGWPRLRPFPLGDLTLEPSPLRASFFFFFNDQEQLHRDF